MKTIMSAVELIDDVKLDLDGGFDFDNEGQAVYYTGWYYWTADEKFHNEPEKRANV